MISAQLFGLSHFQHNSAKLINAALDSSKSLQSYLTYHLEGDLVEEGTLSKVVARNQIIAQFVASISVSATSECPFHVTVATMGQWSDVSAIYQYTLVPTHKRGRGLCTLTFVRMTVTFVTNRVIKFLFLLVEYIPSSPIE